MTNIAPEAIFSNMQKIDMKSKGNYLKSTRPQIGLGIDHVVHVNNRVAQKMKLTFNRAFFEKCDLLKNKDVYATVYVSETHIGLNFSLEKSAGSYEVRNLKETGKDNIFSKIIVTECTDFEGEFFHKKKRAVFVEYQEFTPGNYLLKIPE